MENKLKVNIDRNKVITISLISLFISLFVGITVLYIYGLTLATVAFISAFLVSVSITYYMEKSFLIGASYSKPKDLVSNTIFVIISSIIISLMILGLDYIMNSVKNYLL